MKRLFRLLFVFTFIFLSVPLISVSAACSHVYDGACDAICNLCSEERIPPHAPDMSAGWIDGGDFHYVPCALCFEVARSAPHSDGEYTVSAAGHELACTACNKIFDSGEHTLVILGTGGEKHTLGCLVCDYSVSERHSCKLQGDKDGHQEVCAECGEVLASGAHTADEYIMNSLGHTVKCSVCGETLDFVFHSATDGSCACGYKELPLVTVAQKPEHRIIEAVLWISLGAVLTLLGAVVYIKREGILALIRRIKKKIDKN